MLSKQKDQKMRDKKPKNLLLKSNNIIKNTLLESHSKNESKKNKPENKSQDKRINSKSISNYNKHNFNLKSLKTEPIEYKQKPKKSKNNVIINRINSAKAQDNLFNICKMSNFLQNANFKKTIIIDNEGNNNLELLINQGNNNNTLIKENIKEYKKEKDIEPITESKEKEENINTETTNLFTTSCENNNLMKNTFNDKQNSDIKLIINENEEDNKEEKLSDNKRLDEYSQIFKLLNENIEQFKNIFNKNDSTKEHKKINSSQNQNKFNNENTSFFSKKVINIIPYKDNYTHQKGKSNKNIYKYKKSQILTSPRNSKFEKNKLQINKKEDKNKIYTKKPSNKNIDEVFNEGVLNNSFSKIIEKDKSNSEIFSFLGSFTQEEFFQSNTNPYHKKHSSKSLSNKFLLDDKTKNKENKEKEEDDMQIEVCGTEGKVKFGELKNRKMNPHFFSNGNIENNNNKMKNIEDKKKKNNNINEQRDCYIF